MDYYFTTSALQDIRFDQDLPISWDQLMQILQLNLSEKHLNELFSIRLLYDIENLRHYFMEEPLNSYGNHTKNTLKNALASFQELPSYIFDFLSKYSKTEQRIDHFDMLFSQYFQNLPQTNSRFIQEYRQFEYTFRLSCAALRAKMSDFDYLKVFEYEDIADPIVFQLLSQKDANEIEPPAGFEPLASLFKSYSDNPYELQRNLLEWKLEKIQILFESNPFGIDSIFAYVIKYIIIDQWQSMSPEQGLEYFKAVLEEFQ